MEHLILMKRFHWAMRQIVTLTTISSISIYEDDVKLCSYLLFVSVFKVSVFHLT